MIREWLCAMVPYCLRSKPDRSAALRAASREHTAAAQQTAEHAAEIKRSGDVLGALTHSMKNALVEKYLLERERPENGNIPHA